MIEKFWAGKSWVSWPNFHWRFLNRSHTFINSQETVVHTSVCMWQYMVDWGLGQVVNHFAEKALFIGALVIPWNDHILCTTAVHWIQKVQSYFRSWDTLELSYIWELYLSWWFVPFLKQSGLSFSVQQVAEYLCGGELARLALTCTRLYSAFNQVSSLFWRCKQRRLGTWVCSDILRWVVRRYNKLLIFSKGHF